MKLEDHVGDIVSKARFHAGISAAMAAKAAGLTPSELSELEESGACSGHPDYDPLARLIGLHPGKLATLAAGWLPEATALETWRELRTITTSGGGMEVNCYLVWDEVTREAAVFDTGWSADPIQALLQDNQLSLRHIFITHSHTDHVAALDSLRGRHAKALLHTGSKSAPPQHRNRPEDFIQLGSLRITNRDTPGHAEDGVTYVVGSWPDDAPPVAIVGDAIFAGSIGRGNPSGELAIRKVREQIFTLPPETLVCPGHGPTTTVAQEIAHNPFFV